MDRVRGEILVWRLLHPLLGEEDQAAHQTLELCCVRREEGLQVVVGIVYRSGLLGRLWCKEAEILGAVEVEFEGRRVGLQKVAVVFYPPDNDTGNEWVFMQTKRGDTYSKAGLMSLFRNATNIRYRSTNWDCRSGGKSTPNS